MSLASAAPLAALEHVSKLFGAVRALDDVSFVLTPGLTGLVGPNGAGKTTALRILSTVIQADSGRIEVMGEAAAPTTMRNIRRQLGYMPQESGLYRWFRTRDFLEYMATLKEISLSERRAEVDRVLEAVDLLGVQDRRIRSLSGGMRRRVLLGQALLGHPPVLILDEPTAGLDPEQRLRFVELLAEAGEKRAVLVSTHQTEGLEAVARTMVVIFGGRLLFDGTPSELARTAEGRVWVATERPTSALAAIRSGVGQYRCIGDPPAGAERVRPTIDDAYLLLTHAAAR